MYFFIDTVIWHYNTCINSTVIRIILPNASVMIKGQNMDPNPCPFLYVRIKRHLISWWHLFPRYFPNISASQKEESWIASILQIVKIMTLDFSKAFCIYGEWVNTLSLEERKPSLIFAFLSLRNVFQVCRVVRNSRQQVFTMPVSSRSGEES